MFNSSLALPLLPLPLQNIFHYHWAIKDHAMIRYRYC
jgi:hypothetical protein